MLEQKNKPLPGPGTVIGANVKLVGALRDVNDITIHGAVDGEVVSEKAITVGETATVKGPVAGATITIAGTVRGAVEADSRLEIMPTGKVYGNITTRDLIIRSGATFVGKSTMASDEKEKEALGKETEETKEAPAAEKKPEYEVE